MAHLGWELDSAGDTLGQQEFTLLGSSLDSAGQVVGVGRRRHVDLVLVGKEPGKGNQLAVRPCMRVLAMTHFLMVGLETPFRASSG